MTLTHARCGGVLRPIPAPEWAQYSGDPMHRTPPEYARCERCDLPGEVAGEEVPEKNPAP